MPPRIPCLLSSRSGCPPSTLGAEHAGSDGSHTQYDESPDPSAPCSWYASCGSPCPRRPSPGPPVHPRCPHAQPARPRLIVTGMAPKAGAEHQSRHGLSRAVGPVRRPSWAASSGGRPAAPPHPAGRTSRPWGHGGSLNRITKSRCMPGGRWAHPLHNGSRDNPACSCPRPRVSNARYTRPDSIITARGRHGIPASTTPLLPLRHPPGRGQQRAPVRPLPADLTGQTHRPTDSTRRVLADRATPRGLHRSTHRPNSPCLPHAPTPPRGLRTQRHFPTTPRPLAGPATTPNQPNRNRPTNPRPGHPGLLGTSTANTRRTPVVRHARPNPPASAGQAQ